MQKVKTPPIFILYLLINLGSQYNKEIVQLTINHQKKKERKNFMK